MFLHQLACDVREFALLQLRLPKNGIRVAEAMLDPSILLNVIQIDETARVRISVGCRKDTSASQLKCFLLGQIISVFGIQHTICKCLSRSNAEQVPTQSCAIRIDVVKSRTLGRSDASTHCAHRQAHSFVGVNEVGKDFRGGCYGNAAFVSEFVQSTLHA
jgi:hypothetical protein